MAVKRNSALNRARHIGKDEYAGRDRNNQKLRALGSVFSKTNRILTGDRKVIVRIQSDYQMDPNHFNSGLNKVSGYTDYPVIYINSTRFGELRDPKVLLQYLGVNYHELCHVMFTPRDKKWIPIEYVEAWMILEDQRIESFFTAMYEPAGKFFTEMFLNHVIDNESAWPAAFFYSCGRSYLPLEIRQEFESRFILPDKVDEVRAVINEFKSFVSEDFRYNKIEVTRVLKEFTALLALSRQQLLDEGLPDAPMEQCADPGTDQPDESMSDREVDEKREQEAAKEDRQRREKEEETGEDQSNFWEEEEDGDSDGGEDEDNEGQGDSSDDDSDGEESDGDADDDSGDDDGGDGERSSGSDSDEDSDEDDSADGVEDDSSSGAGNNADDHETEEMGFDDDELLEYMEDIQEAVQQDSAVQDEVKMINAAMDDRSNIDLIDFGLTRHEEEPVGVEDSSRFNSVVQHFRKLYAEVEPGWKYGSDVGKLNVGRAMLDPENYDEHFDEWDEGREHESGIEAFIALDMSISMNDNDAHIHSSHALWVIKTALDDVGAKTTVVGFHADTVGLYSREEEAPKGVVPVWNELGGNTIPHESFHLARGVLSNSPMPNKLFIIITDGDWTMMYHKGGEWLKEDIPELVQSIPGTRLYVGVNGGGGSNVTHQQYFHGSTDLADPGGLVSLVDDAVTEILNSRR